MLTLDTADRRFYSWLGLIFGPLFVLGGFIAAFTIEGALFVWLGLAMLVAGIGLRTRLSLAAVLVSAAAVLLALCSYTLFVYPLG
ncbi:MAG: hypothetical protein AB7J35_21985 [Dehalococcoidia bacterium]